MVGTGTVDELFDVTTVDFDVGDGIFAVVDDTFIVVVLVFIEETRL